MGSPPTRNARKTTYLIGVEVGPEKEERKARPHPTTGGLGAVKRLTGGGMLGRTLPVTGDGEDEPLQGVVLGRPAGCRSDSGTEEKHQKVCSNPGGGRMEA